MHWMARARPRAPSTASTKLTAEAMSRAVDRGSPADMSTKAKATRKPAMRAYPNLPKDDLDALVAFLVEEAPV